MKGGGINSELCQMHGQSLDSFAFGSSEPLDKRSGSAISTKRSSSQQSASFRSKVPRLAPAMALIGLAAECLPSNLSNPGPGAYCDQSLQDSKPKLEMIKSLIMHQQEASLAKREKLLDAIRLQMDP